MLKQQQNTKAGLHYRLSRDDQRAGESLSIENPKRILEKYARENGFEIVDEYIDDGWAGTNFDRSGVQRLLEDARNGRINVIIVKDLSCLWDILKYPKCRECSETTILLIQDRV